MPVRSLNSSVLKWPDKSSVEKVLRHWVEKAKKDKPEVLGIGYFGSYSRNDWGVGSDLDVIIILKSSSLPFLRRSVEWDTREIPVPVDLLIYTEEEWQSLSNSRFYKVVMNEAVWIYKNDIS